MLLTISMDPHPLLEIELFVTRFATSLARTETPPAIAALVEPDAGADLTATDEVRAEVRQLLRAGGFKPAGRSKPASEYLVAAATERRFPRINAAVDACNVVSLHSGLPISLVDVDRMNGHALRIGIAPAATSYVFNASGQVIDASGLVCAFDGEGPTGTPVKDAQRTKTHDDTRATLSIIWGTTSLPGRTARTARWYRELVSAIAGATIEDVTRA